VKYIKNNIEVSHVHRFLGASNIIVQSYKTVINACIELETHNMLPLQVQSSDEFGMLYLYPIEDNKFCLLLYYYVQDSQSNKDQVFIIRFLPDFFAQYPLEILAQHQPFRFDQTTELQFPICNQSIQILEQLQSKDIENNLLHLLHQQQRAISLLARALECILVPFTVCQVPACRFLSQNGEREKIQEAVNYIDLHIEENVTIRDLARKVAINECYLKKGFKAITGKTIHDYRLSVRMERAQKMLTESGNTVTDVAMALGFSSISHFSTAFKKYTGLKPCALLS
jgi:AraC-like DNA-binding protein